MAGRGGHDIHGYAERVERYLALIAGSKIPDEDKRALTEFSEVLRAQGLRLELQVAAGGNGTYRIAVQEHNTMNVNNSVAAKNGWAYPEQNLNPFSPCSLSLFPVGLAIFQGHYTLANYSQARPLLLYNTTYYPPCKTQANTGASFVFMANGSEASLIDSQSRSMGVWNITDDLLATGYWTGGAGTLQPAVLHPFHGGYTVLAADEWGAVIIEYFTA